MAGESKGRPSLTRNKRTAKWFLAFLSSPEYVDISDWFFWERWWIQCYQEIYPLPKRWQGLVPWQTLVGYWYLLSLGHVSNFQDREILENVITSLKSFQTMLSLKWWYPGNHCVWPLGCMGISSWTICRLVTSGGLLYAARSTQRIRSYFSILDRNKHN